MSRIKNIDRLSIALAIELGFEDIDYPPFEDNIEIYLAGIAKYAMPIYLHDAISATCYLCQGKSISFNFPNCTKANNCVIKMVSDWYDYDNTTKYRLEFNKIEMLDNMHVNTETAKSIAMFAVEKGGLASAFEDFTGISLVLGFTSLNEWGRLGEFEDDTEMLQQEYSEWEREQMSDDEWNSLGKGFVSADKLEEIQHTFNELHDELYPDPSIAPEIKQGNERSMHEKIRLQLERIQMVQQRETARTEQKEQEKRRSIQAVKEEQQKERDANLRRIKEKERDVWKEWIPLDTEDGKKFFDEMMDFCRIGNNMSYNALDLYGSLVIHARGYFLLLSYGAANASVDEIKECQLHVAKEWFEKLTRRARILDRLHGKVGGNYDEKRNQFMMDWDAEIEDEQ